MATLDEAKAQAEKAAETVGQKAAEFAGAADEWASKSRPEIDSALETAGGVAEGAIDKIAQGADAAYEAIKNKLEEASGQDVDGDGKIGKTDAAPGEVKAGVEVAAEAVAGAAGKVADAAKGMFDRLGKKDEEA